MTIKVTTIAENSVPMGATGLIGEHGQAFYLESGDRRILFDTGQGLALVQNAEALGIDLKQIDTVILSHGHNDHSGGLGTLTEINPNYTLIAHPHIFLPKLVKKPDGRLVSRGMAVDQANLERAGIRCRLETGPVQITETIQTTGEIAQTCEFEAMGSTHFTTSAGETMPDRLDDDRALILNTEQGTVVLLGCTHRGLINTLRQVTRQTGEKKIHAIIGGLHMTKASDERIKQMIDHLHAFDVEKICVGHCTGIRAIHALMTTWPDRVLVNAVGNIMTF